MRAPTSSWPTWRVTGCWRMPSRPMSSASSRTATWTTTGSGAPWPRWPTRREDPDRDQCGRGEPRTRDDARAGTGHPRHRIRLVVAPRGADAARARPARRAGLGVGCVPAAQDRHDDAAAGPQPRVAGQGGRHARHALGRALPPHVRAGARHRRGAQRRRDPERHPCSADGRCAAGAAAPVGRRRGLSRGSGGVLRRRLGLAPTGAGPLRRLAGRQRPGGSRALRPPGRRVDPRFLHTRGRRSGQGGDRPGGRRTRPRHQCGALRRQPRLCTRGHRRGGAGVVALGPPCPRPAAGADRPGRARPGCAP